MSDLLNYILAHEDAFRKNRLPSLYSDFTLQKTTNPDGYAVNVGAWEQALIKAARQGYISRGTGSGQVKTNHLVLKANESLLRDLEIPELGQPVALGTVVDEAVEKRTMVPLQVYRTSGASLRKKGWIDPGTLSPWNVMSWGMKQLRGIVVGSDGLDSAAPLRGQELVLVENLQEAASRVVKQATAQASSKMDLVNSREGFMNEYAGILDAGVDLSETDFDVLLLYLSRDSGSIAYDGKTIKFRPTPDTPTEITQQDTTIASIKTLMWTMIKQADALEVKIAELTATAKTALNNKNRISALSAVRSKKLAEHNLQRRFDTLAQLEEVYSRIEQATDQVEYIRVMEASTGVLRGLNTQVGDAAKIDEVVDELREEMSKVDEVGNIMSEAGPEIDETEIDDELEALEHKDQEAKDEEEAEETRKKLTELESLERTTKEAARPERDLDSALTDRLSQMSVEDVPGAAH
ncbi:putative vacuolar sorting protein SNF7 family protein [Aspergillus ruber CBS 135680]|uniref:SNF7 family protein n=1 Tax=Aspergillus ruber (strain CBS 135680) TaxID=1388766 RepID=A0A017SIF4_ASPRC|nr:SNF7 family protein [Aspergillus ruber CBS 135680]EYE96526.1 SNF7 family protein [Aspergillus ruber CBS 135680]